MKKERLYQILLSQHATEKAHMAMSNNQLIFKVLKNATKAEIAEAFETIYEHKPVAINVLNMKGKSKRFGSKYGKRSDFKKAYIKLDPSVDLEALQEGKV